MKRKEWNLLPSVGLFGTLFGLVGLQRFDQKDVVECGEKGIEADMEHTIGVRVDEWEVTCVV